MANQKIFASVQRSVVADQKLEIARNVYAQVTSNDAGGASVSMGDREAFVQMAVTGTFRDGFYLKAEDQVDRMMKLLIKMDPQFIAQTAAYSRRQGFMKDMPAFLLAYLAKNDAGWFEAAFPHVVDDGKMLKVFTQVIRSGVVGKKSFGSQAKRLMKKWIEQADTKRLLAASVGNNPSLKDVIRLVHPQPKTDEQSAMFAWLVGKEVRECDLPKDVARLVSYRRNPKGELPEAPFMLLTSLNLSVDGWVQICERATWQQLRANLNSFIRHGVFCARPDLIKKVCNRLSNKAEIERSKVMPHQLLAAALKMGQNGCDVSKVFERALFDAIEHAMANAPDWMGQSVAVFLDVSGSMKYNAITGGYGDSNASSISCAQAGGLFASMLVYRNPGSLFLTFDDKAKKVDFEPGSSLLDINKSIHFNGGATHIHTGFEYMSRHNLKANYIVVISDNESNGSMRNLKTLNAFKALKNSNPKMKVALLDLVPNTTTDIPDMGSAINVGGFTDDAFRVIDRFFEDKETRKKEDIKTLVDDISSIDLMSLEGCSA